jgi:pyruvate dehydrogenase E1 component
VATQDILNGLYRYTAGTSDVDASIFFSGTSYLAAQRASEILRDQYDITVDLWSATSYKSLREDAMEVERWNRLHPTDAPRTSLLRNAVGSSQTPIVAVSDFMRIVPEQIAPYLTDRTFLALGTDGMGRSDTREALRRFFETDAEHVVVAVLTALNGSHGITNDTIAQAITEFGIITDATYGLSRD